VDKVKEIRSGIEAVRRNRKRRLRRAGAARKWTASAKNVEHIVRDTVPRTNPWGNCRGSLR